MHVANKGLTVAILLGVMVCAGAGTSAREPLRLAQSDEPDVSLTGNPSTAPLKWVGLLENFVDKDHAILCTAQFIAPRVLMTAAHCVQNRDSGSFYNIDKMYFFLQFQNHEYSQLYRPVCYARYDGWYPSRKGVQTADEKRAAIAASWQWDYALILVDGDSKTGHFGWKMDWKGSYATATTIGYPAAILSGDIIQKASGDLFFPAPGNRDMTNVVAMMHGAPNMTQGTSGGAWIANPSKNPEEPNSDILIGVNSYVMPAFPGVSFGPYLTADFTRLLEFVSNGCRQGTDWLRSLGSPHGGSTK